MKAKNGLVYKVKRAQDTQSFPYRCPIENQWNNEIVCVELFHFCKLYSEKRFLLASLKEQKW